MNIIGNEYVHANKNAFKKIQKIIGIWLCTITLLGIAKLIVKKNNR